MLFQGGRGQEDRFEAVGGLVSHDASKTTERQGRGGGIVWQRVEIALDR